MLEDQRLNRKMVRVPSCDDYDKPPMLSANIHPDIKCTLVSMSKRTGMTVSKDVDEVLYTGLIEMYELDRDSPHCGCIRSRPYLYKVVTRIFIRKGQTKRIE